MYMATAQHAHSLSHLCVPFACHTGRCSTLSTPLGSEAWSCSGGPAWGRKGQVPMCPVTAAMPPKSCMSRPHLCPHPMRLPDQSSEEVRQVTSRCTVPALLPMPWPLTPKVPKSTVPLCLGRKPGLCVSQPLPSNKQPHALAQSSSRSLHCCSR